MTVFAGTAGNDTLVGTSGADTFDISQGGDDTVNCNGGDIVNVGGALTSSDHIVGAGYNAATGGINTVQVVLDGDYASGLVLASTTLVNVTGLTLTAGHSYKITINDALMTHFYQYIADTGVDGSSLGATDTLYYDGSAETDAVQGIGGGAGNDTLIGGAAADTITGGGGNDVIYGGGGSDTINGGTGVDVVHGGDGVDQITCTTSSAGSQFFGDGGNDTFLAPIPVGNISYDGGSGLDYLKVNGGTSLAPHNLTVNLAAGTLSDGSNTDHFVSIEAAQTGWGQDTLIGTTGNDWLSGGFGSDVLEGGLGDDFLSGQAVLSQPYSSGYTFQSSDGGWGPEIDTVTYEHAAGGITVDMSAFNYPAQLDGVASGADGLDTIWMVDRIIGSQYNDFMVGGYAWSQDCAFIGGQGNDTLIASRDSNFLSELGGTLDGGEGNDVLVGSAIADVLIGGPGSDTMTGGRGADVYQFSSYGDLSLNADHITDFDPTLDKLDFSAISGLSFIGTSSFSGVAGQMNYSLINGQTVIQVDSNGDGVADGKLVLDGGSFSLQQTAPDSRILFADATPPSVASFSLLNKWSDNKPAGIVVVTFSEAVKRGSGNIEFHKSDGTLVCSVGASTGWVTSSGNQIRIMPSTALDPATSYYVVLPVGTVTDLIGNPFVGTSSPTEITFTTAATPPADLQYPSRTGNSIVVTSNSATITLTYSEAVKAGTGTVLIGLDGNLVESISANDPAHVTYNGNVVTITTSANLFGNTNYTLLTSDDAIEDLAGNSALRIDSVSPLGFRTSATTDGTSPWLTGSTGSDGQPIAPDAPIILTFDEAVRAGLGDYLSAQSAQFSIYRSDGTLVKEILASDAGQAHFSGNTVTLTPLAPLPGNTSFSIVFSAKAVQDTAGNYAVVPAPLSFSTYSQSKGTNSADVLPGTNVSDRLIGYAGNDMLNGGAGNDTLDGGPGVDTAVYSGNSAAYTITRSGGMCTVTGPDGTDTLTNIERLQFADQTVSVGALAKSDFNDDAASDFLWQNTSGQAGVWLLNGTTISAASAVGPNPGPSWLVKGSGDFDGDGKSDILWQNTNGQAGIWFMDGTTLVSGVDTGSNPGPSWHVIGAGDFNGDSSADILWQNDSGQAGIWLMDGNTIQSAPVVGTNPGTSWKVKGASDFDGDGKSDILWQSTSGQAGIWFMNGTNVLSQVITGGNPGSSWHVICGADFNGDGKADILWQSDSGQVGIWLMNGNSVVSAPVVGSNSNANLKVKAAVDVDGDGKADIVFENATGNAHVWFMNGTTVLSQQNVGVSQGTDWQIANNGFAAPTSGVRGDFDGNGRADLLWQSDSGQAGIWLLNGSTILSSPTVGANPGPSWHVKGSGDFDGDGKADILWQSDSGQAGIWLMNGTAVLSSPTVGPNPGPSWKVIGAGDFDGDGKADILWQSTAGQAGIWFMNGTNIVSLTTAGNNPGSNWHVIGSSDFNGDGKADILWQSDSGQAGIWLMNGTTVLSAPTVGANPGSTWHIKGAGDFDGDGKSDILWQSDSGQAGIWFMDGTAVLSAVDTGNNRGSMWQVKGAADVNGDGKADILWQNTNGQANVWLMNGNTPLSTPSLGANPGSSWQIAVGG